MVRCRCLWWLACLTAAAMAVSASAGERSFGAVVAAPGARSLGLGGAFVAIADDATATYANPAGLVQLLRPELSAELRTVAGIGDDETPGLIERDITGIGYISGVLPLGRWNLAAFGHQAAEADLVGGVLGVDDQSFEVRRYALASAVRLGDTFSLGLAVSYFDGELAAPGVVQRQADDVGLTLGVLWSPTWWLNLGAFSRQEPELEFKTVTGADLTLEMADVVGIGVALRPGRGRWTIGLEWDRLQHSSQVAVVDEIARTVRAAAGDQLHLGIEYVALKTSPVTALRMGVWRRAERRAEGWSPPALAGVVNRDETHVAAGFGLAWSRGQMDIGLDYTDSEVTVAASVIVMF